MIAKFIAALVFILCMLAVHIVSVNISVEQAVLIFLVRFFGGALSVAISVIVYYQWR